VRLTPQFLRALSHLGGRAFYETIFLPTFYEFITFDEFVKSRNLIQLVIPAKAGIRLFQSRPWREDPGFRRGDISRDFLRNHHFSSFD
jgi:hypothetical protein